MKRSLVTTTHRSSASAEMIKNYFSEHSRPNSTFSPMCRQILGIVGSAIEHVDWLVDAHDYRTPLETSLLLMAGMHRQVLMGASSAHMLRDYYPSVGGCKSYMDDQFPKLFLDAMEACKESLIPIIRNETVQTNETQRGMFWLYPVLLSRWDRIHLVDLGASAGLNLVADQRRFTWSDDHSTTSFGSAQNEQFFTKVNPRLPCFWTNERSMPTIESRNGCDLNPFPLSNQADYAKLESYVWPDQLDRFQRLHEGIEAHRVMSEHHRIPIQQVTLPHDLPKYLNSLTYPDKFPVVIYNTYMTEYLENKGAAMLGYIQDWATANGRDVMWVQSEPAPGSPRNHWCAWTVNLWKDHEEFNWHLAWAHPHGIEINVLEDLDEFEAFFRN